ncbi:flagellar hook-basal body complex protein [Novosphingobium sp.]|uniref:flagellar hook-basal body complex protein n=1 Tax=Novosphingobium sp. TaxID=1874826 RepID=UPI002B489473|nr:flagellar hook-basal body complex protein [Novosphingobium sp.]HKR91738.1 flagellar hook-basal body complex protein [Novosphingobium sp.]
MSFYTSLSGLKNAQTDLNVISNNIANAETSGFKKSDTSFADIVASSALADSSHTVGIGSRVATITQNFSLGAINQTGGALDITINGDGFFTVKSPLSGETQYTRNGALTIDGSSYIVNAQGARLQAFPTDPVTGAITSTSTLQDVQIPAASPNPKDPANPGSYAGVTIGKNGQIIATYSDGSNATLGVVAVASFLAPTGLRQLGDSTWAASGNSGAATYAQPGSGTTASLLSGSLEGSNVDIAEELVSLITAQRNFQANAKAIDTATQISQAIMNLRS